jgi:sn-glycerol 3-phosphate transport system ATP-binding protein
VIGIRPEDFLIANGAISDGSLSFELTVTTIERVGAETYIYGMRPQQGDIQAVSERPGEAPQGEILVRIPGQEGPAIGEKIRAAAPREKLHLFADGGRKRIDL